METGRFKQEEDLKLNPKFKTKLVAITLFFMLIETIIIAQKSES